MRPKKESCPRRHWLCKDLPRTWRTKNLTWMNGFVSALTTTLCNSSISFLTCCRTLDVEYHHGSALESH